MMTGKNKTNKNKKGFTLIEVIISISIFIVIVTVSLGAIANIFDANRKSQSLKAIMTNLNFALEVIAREMRFGTNYHCGEDGDIAQPQNCTEGGNFISFLSSDGNQVVYRLNISTNQLEKSINGGSSYIGITAPEITIQSLKFFVLGATVEVAPASPLQPKVIILIKGYAGTKTTSQSVFTLETTVSQRILDTSQ